MTSPAKILIVDDNEESLRLLAEVLRAEGHDVRAADSGELALAAVTLGPPELILLDIRMPGMDGLEVCRQLKSRAESRDIPIILLSASPSLEDRVEGLKCGAVDFISKPFYREELVARLNAHLELARLRSALERRVTERTWELEAANERLENELEERRVIQEELSESEVRFRSMADTAPAGICLFSPFGNPTYASEWLLTFFGLTKEQFEADDDWVRFIHPEDRERVLEEIAAAVKERRPSQVEHRLLRHDGEYRWVAVTASPRFVRDEFCGHICIILDITELKRSQEQVLANQKLESLGVLAAGIAHDFNNMLSTILAHSDLALQDIPEESPARESVSSIAAVAVRASEIINLLISYAGRADLSTFRWVDLSSLVEEMVGLLQVSVPKTTSLCMDLSKDLPRVWANASQIRQVILNVIMNASEAREAQTGTIVVSTSRFQAARGAQVGTDSLAAGDYVLLTVSDSGRGMQKQVKERIFEPFFSTKYFGRGMGLAAVQGIVRGAGGAIEVASSPGQGSTFKIWLPCADRRPGREAGSSGGQATRAGTVLLVHDEEALRELVARALKNEGFSVLEAYDGLAAVQLFAAHSSEIDIVVLDLTGTGLSSRNVCEEIRRWNNDVRILISSAYASTNQGSSGSPGSERFLQKPYRLQTLIETIRDMMAAPGAP